MYVCARMKHCPPRLRGAVGPEGEEGEGRRGKSEAKGIHLLTVGDVYNNNNNGNSHTVPSVLYVHIVS